MRLHWEVTLQWATEVLLRMTLNQHMLEETLEALVMGRLQAVDSDLVEDHLLVCEKCRRRFEEIESFVRATKSAAALIRDGVSKSAGNPGFLQRLRLSFAARPVLAGAGALALAALITVPILRKTPVTYREIALATVRGAEFARPASSQERIRLNLDLRELPPIQTVHLVIVDASGAHVYRTNVDARNAQSIRVNIPVLLPSGGYWVRLVAPGEGGALLREYSLTVQ